MGTVSAACLSVVMSCTCWSYMHDCIREKRIKWWWWWWWYM